MSGEESKTGVAGLCSPVVQEDGSVLVVSSATGGVLAYNDAGELTELFNTGGQPAGAAIGPKGAVFLADVAHGAVIKRGASDGEAKPQAVVVDYEGKPFQGPSSVAFDNNGTLYFTDSGALGETTLQDPKGSVFYISGPESAQILRPLALECLAHPCAIVASARGDAVYVAEMMRNRVLRFAQRPAGVFHLSVFAQLSGGIGPGALALDEQTGTLYVGQYDFKENAETGTVIALSVADGRELNRMETSSPEITGIALGDGVLLVTEGAKGNLQKIAL